MGRDRRILSRPEPPEAPPGAVYAALLELCERERELVRVGCFDDLAALAAARGKLIASLPAHPPPAARGALERALAVQAETSAALEEGMRGLGREMARLGRGRGAVRGYTPATGSGDSSAVSRSA